jgi:hypothetical protein
LRGQTNLTGLWVDEMVSSNLDRLSVALFNRGLAWSTEEIEVFLTDAKKDMKNPKIHAWYPMFAFSLFITVAR